MKYTKLIWTVLVILMVVVMANHEPLHAANHKPLHAANHKPLRAGENYRKKIILFSEKTNWAEIRAYAVKWKKRGVVTSMEIPIINGLVVGVPAGITDAEMAADRRVSSIETNLELSGNDAVKHQGTSFIKPLNRPPIVDEAANRYEAPWSVLKLFDQPYDNRYFSGWLAEEDIPDPVAFALKKLKKAKTPIAVFDTGIDAKHHYTKKIVETGIDVVEFTGNDERIQLNSETPYDDNGHGSHVAGILGEILDRKHQWGQKADVALNSVKILGSDGTGYLSNIIYGLQWAIDNDIKLANMSIGYRQDSPAVRRAVQEAAKAGVIMFASVGNKSNYDPNVTLKVTADGGSADGGSADGGSADGGSADGGSADGGSADGGSADGGSADGGSADGGSADGGSADGGSADGGSADGGSADGGSADGGSADGGSADGGSADGGSADGGSADGGSADGGSADGGSADGGSADGGSADGGSADGGSADGGSADGGSADGGSADGGSADGGSADGGSADGGSADGGSADGGSADGGSADGGSADGGSADGGSADGGSADGGSADGGSADGGSADGGSADGGSADGGSADGGSADGGSADGGSADGGSADGGSADGGSADGGSDNSLPEFSVMYPARYPEVIAVGASNAYGKLATFSNSGKEMDILAPGASILSVDITNGDRRKGLGITSGTSMSVPYVTAAAAMMLAIDPTLGADEVREILVQTAHRIDAGSSAGDLNLVAALDEVMFRITEDNAYDYDNREKEKKYRQHLRAKIRDARKAPLN